MRRRPIVYATAVLAALTGALAVPAADAASSGQPSRVSASGGGITVSSSAAGWYRGRLTVSGQADAGYAGTTVQLQRLGRQTGWRWTPTAHAVVRNDGSFAIVWRVNRVGKFELRVVILAPASSPAGDGGPPPATVSPPVTVTLYQSAVATFYGPGLWGNHTACGQKLTRTTLGVANRTLPCGTRVALLYHGHTIVVPVIDRGPYANGADWDLTQATAKRLGMSATATIGAAPLRTSG